MGVDNFQYGDNLNGFAKFEATYGVGIVPAATDAFRAMSMSLAPVVNREVLTDRRGTRSRMESVEHRTSATWSVSAVYRPSGALGSAADIGDLMKLAFGTQTITGSTSVVYTLLDDLTALSVSLYQKLTNITELVYGAVCSNWAIRWSGNSLVMLEFSGVGKGFTRTGNSLVDGQGTTTANVVVDDADFYGIYSIVEIGTDDNGGAGYQVTAAPTHASELLVIDTATSFADNAVVDAYLPTPTLAGDPIYGTKCTTSLDGGSTDTAVLSGSVSGTTGASLVNEEAGTSSPSDVIMDDSQRSVDVELEFLVKKDEVHLFEHHKRKVTTDVNITLGDTAAKRMVIDMPIVEFDPAGFDVPQYGAARVSVSGRAYGSSTGGNEITITEA